MPPLSLWRTAGSPGVLPHAAELALPGGGHLGGIVDDVLPKISFRRLRGRPSTVRTCTGTNMRASRRPATCFSPMRSPRRFQLDLDLGHGRAKRELAVVDHRDAAAIGLVDFLALTQPPSPTRLRWAAPMAGSVQLRCETSAQGTYPLPGSMTTGSRTPHHAASERALST